jgi:hypothetical protein
MATSPSARRTSSAGRPQQPEWVLSLHPACHCRFHELKALSLGRAVRSNLAHDLKPEARLSDKEVIGQISTFVRALLRPANSLAAMTS